MTAAVTLASMGNGPAFSVYRSTNYSITTNTNTKIPLNTEEFDTANAFDSTTNYRFTPLVAGYYQINLSAYLAGSGINNAQAYIYKNGAYYKGTVQAGSISVTDWNCSVQAVIYMNGSTDYLEGYVYVTGSGLVIAGGGGSTYMSGVLVRGA